MTDDPSPFARSVDELATLLGLRGAGGEASERDRARSRLLRPYLRVLESETDRSQRAEFVRYLLAVDAITPIGDDALEQMAVVTKTSDDDDLSELILTRLVESNADAGVRIRAHEALGELLEDQGEARKAASSFKAAARLRDDGGDTEQARRLYERALDIQPTDAGAAERLVALHVLSGAWKKIPEFMGALLRADEDRGAEVLLALQARALQAGALAVFADMANEALALRPPTSQLTHELRRALSRALAVDRNLEERASASYRILVEAFGDDADAREYLAFLASAKDAAGLHHDRRWVFAWRAERERAVVDPSSLLAWAKAEEAHGDLDEAVRVHRRLLDVPSADRPTSWLALFDLLERLGRRDEALEVLAHLLGVVPPIEQAHAAARRRLVEPAAGNTTALSLEGIAATLDADGACGVLAFLIASRGETKGLAESRRRWHRRLAELRADRLDLGALLEDAANMPDDLGLWDAAEGVARAHSKLGDVVRAYTGVLRSGDASPELAETLGRRATLLEGEANVEPNEIVDVVEAVLALVPSSWWALERAKVVLGSLGNWDALFRHYDRAIETTSSEKDRAELLDEAAFAARDAADDPDRAIQYLERIIALRADDEKVAHALERLYERRGRAADLAARLEQRAAEEEGATRRELLRRIAGLRLDTQSPEAAAVAVDAMITEGATLADVTDLLERLASHPSQQLARERLAIHYESTSRLDDLVRIRVAALTLTNLPSARVHSARELVRVRLLATKGQPDTFASTSAAIASEIEADTRTAKGAHRALLIHAVAALRSAPTDIAFEQAAEAARSAIEALSWIFLEEGEPVAAARVLERGARLRIDRPRQRTLMHRAAVLWADRIGDARRATRLFTEVFQDDIDDPVAQRAFDHLRAHFEAASLDGKLAALWEDRGDRAGRAGNTIIEGDSFVNAGVIWERMGDSAQAVRAYARGAALAVDRLGADHLGVEVAFESLARIHTSEERWSEAIPPLEWLHARARAEARGHTGLRLARAHLAMGERVKGRACLEDVLSADAGSAGVDEVRRELIELHRQDERWAPLADLLEVQGAFREAAEVRHTKLGDVDGAVRLFDLAIAAHPDDAVTRPILAGLLEGLERWDRVVDTLLSHVAVHGDRRPAESAAIRHRLASALLRLDRQKDALVELQVAAKLQPSRTDILRDLGRVASDVGDLEVAERAYRALLLAVRRESDLRNEVYLDLATIALRRGDEARADNLLESALEAAFEDDAVPPSLEKALVDRKRYDLLARALEWRVERAPSASARAEALLPLAEAWQVHLAKEPELGRRVALLLGATIEALPPNAERARLRTTLAKILTEHPGQANEAIAHLSSALRDDPAGTAPLDLLEYILERDGRQDEAATLLRNHLETLSPSAPEWTVVGWRLGRTLERVDRRDEARTLYESILDSLDARPPNIEDVRALASRLDACSSERLADCLERSIAIDPESTPAVVARLIELRDWQRDDAGLERALERGFAADASNKVYCEKLVQCCEQRQDLAAVARVLSRALDAMGGGDGELLRRLCEAHRKMGEEAKNLPLLDAAISAMDRGFGGSTPERRHDDALYLLRATARESVGDDAGAIADLGSLREPATDAVVVLLERLTRRASPAVVDVVAMKFVDALISIERNEQAQRELEDLLEQAPEHVGALERLAAMAVAASDWPRARDVYRRLLALRGEGAPAPLVISFADACERAGSPSDARAAVERALEARPEDERLAQTLERICESQKAWERVIELTIARAHRTANAKARSPLFLRAAQLLNNELDSSAEALRVAELARDADPASVEAALVCGRLYSALGRPRDALAVLEPVTASSRGKRATLLARAHLLSAHAHLELDELIEARDALKAGFAADVRSREIAMLFGLVAMDLGEDTTAERAFLAVTAFRPRAEDDAEAVVSDQRVAYNHLASMASARGEEAKAQRWRSKAAGDRSAFSVPPPPPSSDRDVSSSS